MNTSLISNPPYNLKWTPPPFAQMQPRFADYTLPPTSNANYAFILTAIDMIDDKAVLLLPSGVLSTSDAREEDIRKWLVENNLIEAVISCPDKMFEATSIATCIVVFNKKKTTTGIEFINARKFCGTEDREQNGQLGGASHTNRTYKKSFNTFHSDHINAIVSAVLERQTKEGFCVFTLCESVRANGYSLVPSRYVEMEYKGTSHRSYNDIIDDINRVNEEKNLLKLTINETIAKSIGLYEVGEIQKESMKNAERIEQMARALFNKKIVKDDYISLTKNKNEIKFENNSKDKMSPIFANILQMWRFNISYLNTEESRYLAELGDALLPDLMSGLIKITEQE